MGEKEYLLSGRDEVAIIFSCYDSIRLMIIGTPHHALNQKRKKRTFHGFFVFCMVWGVRLSSLHPSSQLENGDFILLGSIRVHLVPTYIRLCIYDKEEHVPVVP
jgi:hypothetical protein